MKILIIATWFYPDTAVAAKRPYYFAKYLAQLGHDVTVLRSGSIYEAIDENLDPSKSGFRILSYLGENSPAEKYARGEAVLPADAAKRGSSFLPSSIRSLIVPIYYKVMPDIQFLKWKKARSQWWEQNRKYLDAMKTAGETFDAVFTTYGDLENIWAGEYAKELFGCPWIMDLRDPLAARWAGRFGYRELLKLEAKAIDACTACTVISKGMADDLLARYPGSKVIALHNGYEAQTDVPAEQKANKKLSFCYTGALYMGRRELTALFEAFQELSKRGKIDLENVEVIYAGRDFADLQRQAEKWNMTDRLVNYGYVSRTKAAELQNSADFFVVASWNTKDEQGVLTGKFYEGIQVHKPILSLITGEVPDSELYLMNEAYHYGFCYEACKKETQFEALCGYLLDAYECKMSGKPVSYAPEPGLVEDFRYDHLAKKLEQLLLNEIADSERSNGHF